MARARRDDEREARIAMEIVVDAYGPEEQAIAWHCYLADRLSFPFSARCKKERLTSPLKKGDTVEVLGMAPEEECRSEMLVMTRWEREKDLAVPLAQLDTKGSDKDASTIEAVSDWHYWMARGYELA